MHLAGTTYDEVYGSFRWEMPARFNIAHLICDRHAAATPDAPALLYETSDGKVRPWNFGELQTCANRIANALAALGVGRGVIVGIHLPQCPESLISHIAIQKLGAIALPMFTLFGPDAIGYRLRDSGARVLISTPEALSATPRPCAGWTHWRMSSASADRDLEKPGTSGRWLSRPHRNSKPPTPNRTIRRC